VIGAVVTVARKDLALLLGDRAALFCILVLPLLVAAPLGAVFAGGMLALAPLSIQAIDEDRTDASRAFFVTLESTPGVRVARAASLEAGRAAVRRGRAAAMLVARPGLEAALASRRPAAGGDAPLQIYADPGREAEIATLRGLVADAAVSNFVLPQPLELLPSLRGAAGVPGLPRVELVALDGAIALPRSPYALSFPAGMAWAVIGCAAGFAVSLAREQRLATRLRLAAAPVAGAAVPLGKALACALTLALMLALLTLVAAAFFGLRPQGAAPLATAFAGIVLCGAGLAVLLGQCGGSDATVAVASWAILLALALLGGAVVPLHLLPEWMQAAAPASPLGWVARLGEGVLWRGQGWPALWRPSLGLAGFGLACLALGSALSARRRAP